MTDRPEDLRKEVELLKKKTQQNRDVADEALQTADAALNSTDTVGQTSGRTLGTSQNHTDV